MLEVGNGGMTYYEYQAHFSLCKTGEEKRKRRERE
jgi:hypothetical protein